MPNSPWNICLNIIHKALAIIPKHLMYGTAIWRIKTMVDACIYIYVDLGYFQYIKTRGKILEKGSKYTRWAPSSVNGVMGPFAKFFLLTMVKNHHLFFHLFVRPDSRGERVIPLLHPGRFTNGT